MKRFTLFILACLISTGVADAAVRSENAVQRNNNQNNTSRTATNTVSRTNNQSTKVTDRTNQSQARSATQNVTNRSQNIPGPQRESQPARVASTRNTTVNTARSATVARSGTSDMSVALGAGYNSCRDLYFTCMDQFCAARDETYRRCVCSSRLEEIKSKERAVAQTGEQLQDFKDLNIDSISKTNAEVKAMMNASTGEKTAEKSNDTSDSASKLAGISSVLSTSKAKALSTQGKLDIAGDINSIWSTTNLAAGADIMNLTGEKLYNTVHAQCIEFASQACDSPSTVNMVVSAYGMYIENDCTNISNALNKMISNASSAIRQTEREMNVARLENYNVHNSTAINECIAQVRKDITNDTACGKDYIHCLDITGKYLNRDTGAPIYSPDFYQLETMTSLSGDIINNQSNRLLISELNRKKEFAKRGLDTCRDLSDEVWDEFLRQSVTEIYQGQQARIREVKKECIDVVNNCYDTQSKSLKDFSNVKEQLLIGARLELSEQMCKEKLDACSNLYGGGPNGLSALVDTMINITDQKIAQDCKTALIEYAEQICMVPSNDTLHAYPFACRTYKPGNGQFATDPACNKIFSSGQAPTWATPLIEENKFYRCTERKKYTSCKPGFYMFHRTGAKTDVGNRCVSCPPGYTCAGGTEEAKLIQTGQDDCGDYAGSLYQKLVRYALQSCVRPTKANDIIPTEVLADVNSVMDQIKIKMGKELAAECARYDGIWIDTPKPKNFPNDELNKKFYEETSSDDSWGHCTKITTTTSP